MFCAKCFTKKLGVWFKFFCAKCLTFAVLFFQKVRKVKKLLVDGNGESLLVLKSNTIIIIETTIRVALLCGFSK